MSSFLNKVEQKLGDHENVSADPSVAPKSGQGEGVNPSHDPNKSWVENKKQAGMGADSTLVGKNDPEVARRESIRAGGTTSADTKGSGETGGAI